MSAAPVSLQGAPARIETPRLTLTPFNRSHADSLTALITESIDHLMRWQSWAVDEPLGVHRRRTALDELSRQFVAGESAHYAVVRRADGVLLGSAALLRGKTPDRIEIGYWMGSAHLRQGHASEAANALTQAAFGPIRLRRLELWADIDNQASNAVARRLGFVHTREEPSYLREHAPPMNVWIAQPAQRAFQTPQATQPRMYDAAGLQLTF